MRAIVISLVTGVCLQCVSLSAADKIPEPVTGILEANAKNLGPLSVEWSKQRTSETPLSALLAKLNLPATEQTFLSPESAVFVLDGPLRYERIATFMSELTKDGKKFVKPLEEIREVAFDGEVLYSGRPPDAKVGRSMLFLKPITRAREVDGADRYFETGYFVQAGYWLASTPGELAGPPASLVLHYLSDGAKLTSYSEETLPDRKAARIEMATVDGRVVFDLDPGIGYAVRRREEYSNDRLAKRADMSDFVSIVRQDTKIWLPKTCVVTYWQWPSSPVHVGEKSPLFRDEYQVASIRGGPISKDRFKLAYSEPGTYVIDAIHPEALKSSAGQIEYEVPADSNMLDDVIHKAAQRAVPRQNRFRWLFISINVIVIILIVFVAVKRSRSRRAERV